MKALGGVMLLHVTQGPIYLVYYVPDVTKSTGVLKIFGFSNCSTALYKGQIYTVNGSF